MLCKHSITLETCSLCQGKHQEKVKGGFGVPPWFVNSIQMAVRSSYAEREKCSRGFSFEGHPEPMPKGSTNKDCKTSLPYRKSSKDPKIIQRYSSLIRKKEG